METNLVGFHGEEQFLANSFLCNDDELVRDQLGILASLKTEEPWTEESITNQFSLGKEDFQQIMSDWQQHIGSLQTPDPDDMGLDDPLGLLNTFPNNDLFEEIRESPILSKALTSPAQKSVINNTQAPIDSGLKKEPPMESPPNENCLQNQIITNGAVKAEPGVVRKLTLINGEKEIMGKNIIGLHCLNEIQESPGENCKVTSTVINGKRYRIIIKPKSQNAKKLSDEKIRKSLIKKLSKCTLVPVVEPKEDNLILEMRNGDYDVPILGNDLMLSWDLTTLNPEINNLSDLSDLITKSEPEPPKKVPPLKIKIPKTKKQKKAKSEALSDEEIDVETVNEKVIHSHSLTDLLTKFEAEPAAAKKNNEKEGTKKVEKKNQRSLLAHNNIKNSLPKEMIDRIEASKRKKDCRIPLIQAIPIKKTVRSATRMQDAGVTLHRNKLLKIVSGGDTIQLDHDYCSSLSKKNEPTNNKPATITPGNLTEKNPKKDSGLESGDVSDASEEPHTPDSFQNAQVIQQINSKLLEQRRRGKDPASITKAAAAFFRATNAATLSTTANNSDTVKTMTVSNGNKALTNDLPTDAKPSSEISDIVPSGCDVSTGQANANVDSGSVQTQLSQSDRPKKKLKLEEYLSRRGDKIQKVNSQESVVENTVFSKPISEEKIFENEEKAIVMDATKVAENDKEPKAELKEETQINCEKNSEEKKTVRERSNERSRRIRSYRNRRSSSSSSGEREERSSRGRRSRSRSVRRGSGSSRRESQGKYRYRKSESRERRRSNWSRSPSRSSSRESSSSSDHSGSRWKSNSSVRYRRRSRSRSFSRERSRSRIRGYSNRRRPGNYFNRNVNSRRSRSPHHVYSVREKQRQIEERRVIYVGRVEEGMTSSRLRERFSAFGPIIDISLHFREHGDNYGFVTYAYKADAYDAVEHGNDDPKAPRYDLCFGGRRGFCKERYADLDGMPNSYSDFHDPPPARTTEEESFDLLLKEAQAKLKMRKQKT